MKYAITIILLFVLVSGCADIYEHPPSYHNGYQDGYTQHNTTVLNACIDYMGAVFELEMNNESNVTVMDTIYKIKTDDQGKHVLPYRTIISIKKKSLSMHRLDQYATTDNEHYMIGYITGYDDWYIANKEELYISGLENKMNNSLDIIKLS